MPDDALQNLDIDTLVKTATSGPDSSWVAPTIGKMRSIEQKKETEEVPIIDRMKRDADIDRAAAEKKYTGIEPVDLKPWTQKPAERDPLEAFGSWGSIFAMVASAFTHTPMTNALNASAAAMNAIKTNDQEAYKTAFEAWKENSRLAIERHRMQYEDYQAAADKMKTDMAQGNAMLSVVAAKYGDQATALMNESGLYKELDNLWSSRQRAAEGMLQLLPTLEKDGERHAMLLADPDWQSKDPQRMRIAYQRVTQATSPYGTGRTTAAGSQEVEMQKWHDAFVQENGREPTFDEELEARRRVSESFKAPGGGGNVISSVRGDAIKRQIKEQETKLGRPLTGKEEAAIVNDTVKGGITGNRAERLQARVDQIGYSMEKLDSTLGVLDRYVGAAGIFGRGTRLGERVQDIFGSNKTDRVQFMRDLELLQAMAPRILLDSSGRPLSGEAERIRDIIGGLNVGDTTANTKRSLDEIKKLYDQMRNDTVRRMGGGAGEPASPSEPAPASPEAPAPAPKKQSWKDWPLVSPP